MRQAPKSKAKRDRKRRFSQAVQRETPLVAALISPCRQCRHILLKSLLVLLFTVTCACRGDAKRRLSYQRQAHVTVAKLVIQVKKDPVREITHNHISDVAFYLIQ